MKPPANPASGILLVDKPAGITSHDVVSRTRKLVGTRKVGHAGTLDPMATGLLVLGVNASTRLLTWIVGLDKEYTATIRLGEATTTDDAEGETLSRTDTSGITDEAIHAGIAQLTGPISQRPSSVSAIKVDGQRAYARVRGGEEVVLDPRPVVVSAFDVEGIARGEWLDLAVRVECSSGTYIRALARDLGDCLGVGGHLTQLRRTRIGPFSVAESVPLEEELADRMLAPAEVAGRLFPVVELDEAQSTDLAHGKQIRLPNEGGPLAAVSPEGRLVGLIEVAGGRARVLVNFPAEATS